MKKKVLFVLNNFNIGGPQKSLLSLLYNIDFKKIEVDLLILSNSGTLYSYIPKEVNIIKSPQLSEYALLLPKGFLKKSLMNLVSRNYLHSLSAIYSVTMGKLNKKMPIEKQKHWERVSKKIPKITKNYDHAFGVSGGHSIMFVADCVNASNKIGWIRTDYNVLKRSAKIDSKYFKKMNQILTVSEICREIFVDIFPEEKEKTQVFYNLLPFKMYKNIPADVGIMNVDTEIKIVTICRLDPNKGLDLAIETLKKLLKHGVNLKWFILGEGSYRSELEDIIQKEGLEESFILLGFHFNTAAFIENADIIVHPSRFEGKSNVVDEAKYLLKPIVATRYNTVNEQIIHEETGLIAEMTSDSIVENILKLIDSPEMVEKLKVNLKFHQAKDDASIEVFDRVIHNSKMII